MYYGLNLLTKIKNVLHYVLSCLYQYIPCQKITQILQRVFTIYIQKFQCINNIKKQKALSTVPVGLVFNEDLYLSLIVTIISTA